MWMETKFYFPVNLHDRLRDDQCWNDYLMAPGLLVSILILSLRAWPVNTSQDELGKAILRKWKKPSFTFKSTHSVHLPRVCLGLQSHPEGWGAWWAPEAVCHQCRRHRQEAAGGPWRSCECSATICLEKGRRGMPSSSPASCLAICVIHSIPPNLSPEAPEYNFQALNLEGNWDLKISLFWSEHISTTQATRLNW